jgi:uncharacterized protein HemX
MMPKDERTKGIEPTDAGDARLEEALSNFRLNIHAWSEAAMRPFAPAIAASPHGIPWRRTLAWAMGVLVAVGAASGGIYEHHRQQVLAWQAQQRQMEFEQRAQTLRAAEMDQLLANVDRDVSQEVPDALEPLAQMMSDDGGAK